MRDYSYSRWAPHYFAISAISSEGLIANWLLKNPEERFYARSPLSELFTRILLHAIGRLWGRWLAKFAQLILTITINNRSRVFPIKLIHCC